MSTSAAQRVAPKAGRRGYSSMIEAANPTSSGKVEYDVARVGTFTLGYGAHRRHAAYDDTSYLVVAYGSDHGNDDFYYSCTRPQAHAPTLFGIRLVGKSVIESEEVMQYLASPAERRSPWWITPRRRGPDGHLCDVPAGTHRHVARIVAALVEDFFDRPDADELLAAHRYRHAADRAAETRNRLGEIDRELRLWSRLRSRELAVLEEQDARVRGERRPPLAPAPVHREPHAGRWRPLTTAGERYLRASGLSADGLMA